MADTESTGTDIMGIVSKLMSDPNVMAAVSGAVKGGSSDSSDSAKTSNAPAEPARTNEPSEKPTASPPLDLSALSALLGGAGLSPGRDNRPGDADERKRRCALLTALKPYLNPHRRETIDQMLSIERLGDALRTVKKP